MATVGTRPLEQIAQSVDRVALQPPGCRGSRADLHE